MVGGERFVPASHVGNTGSIPVGTTTTTLRNIFSLTFTEIDHIDPDCLPQIMSVVKTHYVAMLR